MTDFLDLLEKINDRSFPFTKRLIDTNVRPVRQCKTRQVRSDRIVHRILLVDEEMARAMEHLNAASTTPTATEIALHNRSSGSLRKLPISS